MPIIRVLLFALTLLWGQWDALAHLPLHTQEDTDHPHAPCQLCVVYATFDHAVPATPGPLSWEHVNPRPADTAVAAVVAASLASYRARAPPCLV